MGEGNPKASLVLELTPAEALVVRMAVGLVNALVTGNQDLVNLMAQRTGYAARLAGGAEVVGALGGRVNELTRDLAVRWDLGVEQQPVTPSGGGH